MLSVITMLALISFLIIAHELGHFWVAKKCGMRVERFGFGLPFGPTLWSKKIGETEYCIHACLIGGYVGFPDDDPDSDVPKDSPERFENQPLWNRFAVAIAGITVNAIIGWAMMVWVILGWGMPSADVVVGKLLSETTPAAVAGVKPGDTIVAINGQTIVGTMAEQRFKFVVDTIGQLAGQPSTLGVLRNGKPVDITVTPDASGKIGIGLAPVEKFIPVSNPIEAASLSTRFLSGFVVLQFEAMGRMIQGQMNPKELSGPISIVNMGSQVIAQKGIVHGLILTAIISMILAVMNLLPIPALDGGHILFIVIEALKGSPVKKEWQENFTQMGFVGLLLLMGFILWNDVNNTWINPIHLPQGK